MTAVGPADALRIDLLGRLYVGRRGIGDAEEPLSQRAGHLLAYLALHVGRAQRRELLAETLWPDSAPSHSRAYLRRALWQARRTLGVHDQGDVIWSDQDWIELRRGRHLAIDTVELEDTFQTLSRANPAERPALLERCAQVVRRYRGDLLEDCTDEWCIAPRERYRCMYVSLLEWIIDQVREHDQLLVMSFCHRLLALDTAHEWAHQALMWALWTSGDRTRALRQFDLCARHLARELGVGPSSATLTLRDRIAGDVPSEAAATVRRVPRAHG